MEDESGARAFIETRLTPDGQWARDTFLLSGENRLPLLDRTRLHPAGVWHWVALRYGGQPLANFVNGLKELEGVVAFSPIKPGLRDSCQSPESGRQVDGDAGPTMGADPALAALAFVARGQGYGLAGGFCSATTSQAPRASMNITQASGPAQRATWGAFPVKEK